MTNELALAAPMQKPTRLDDSLFSKELAPHYMQLASQLSKSTMVPKSYQGKPQDLFVAMAMGYQIGLSVEQAIQAIAVINGKPCLYGDDMLALCLKHPDFVDIIEEPIVQAGQLFGYSCTVKRKNMTDHTTQFTLEMAKKAGLLSKPGPWTQYPDRMLQLRARSFALRDKFPDALKGIKSREETEDYVDVEVKVIDDKISRVEMLKKDLLTRRSNTDETDTAITNEVLPEQNNQATTETMRESFTERMVDTGKPENTPATQDDSESRSIPSTAKQLATISRLLDSKGFSDERINKALAYYEVSAISDLTTDLADHFIEQLDKI